MAWHSGRTSVSGRRTFSVLLSTCSWWVTTNVGKLSAIGQPLILSGSINWVVSWNQMCAAVYRLRRLVKAMEVTAGLAESNGSLLPGLWRDSLHITCGLTACTPGSAPGPTLGNEYGKTLPFYPKTATHSGTNWAQHGLTSFMRRTPLASMPCHQPGSVWLSHTAVSV